MKWKLREKVLILTVLTALLPFLTANIYWYINSQNATRKNTENTITYATDQAYEKINDYLNTKLLGYLIHAQGPALLNGDLDIIREDLLNLLIQDPDIEKVAFVDMSGKELVKVDKKHVYPQELLADVSTTDEFKVASFKFGKEFIGPVQYGDVTQVNIAVPVTYPENAQSLRTFSSSNSTPRSAEEIRGVLISTIRLNELIENLSTLKVDETGYIYLIDREKRVLSYPDKKFIASIVSDNVLGPPNTKGAPINASSLQNVPVLRSEKTIQRTGWRVVTEIPVNDVLADSTQIQTQALLISIVPLLVLLVLSLYFSRKLINPIRDLVKGTQNIAEGKFDYPFEQIKTGDELEQLGMAYTEMAKKIQYEQHSIIAEKNTLTTVLSSIADGVIALDMSYKIVFLNNPAKQLLNLTDDVTEKTLDSQIQFKDKDGARTIVELCETSADTKQTHKLSFGGAEGENRAVNVTISTVPPSLATNILYLLTFYDVSKEQELENMKLDFVSMAAHELRTPLTAIKGYLGYLHEELVEKLNETETTFLSRVIISADQLSSLIENLLNVTKIERGILKLDVAPFSITKMIEDALVNLQEVALQKSIKINFIEPKFPIPEIKGDKFRITQVFVNLMSNGINYTQQGGEVEINLERRPDSIVVNVKDNGQGIPKAALPHLFTKFYRVGGALEEGSKGTGLGLFISKSIIERHSGKIWVESEEGKGSTFSFSLPIDNEQPK
jgi:signal transduction histidine kinase